MTSNTVSSSLFLLSVSYSDGGLRKKSSRGSEWRATDLETPFSKHLRIHHEVNMQGTSPDKNNPELVTQRAYIQHRGPACPQMLVPGLDWAYWQKL